MFKVRPIKMSKSHVIQENRNREISLAEKNSTCEELEKSRRAVGWELGVNKKCVSVT